MTMHDQDEKILGAALGRAVDSQRVRETPFERSRLAADLARPAPRPVLWRFAAVAAVVALALVVGVGLGQLRSQLPPVGNPSPSPTPGASPTPSSSFTAVPLPGPVDHAVVYLARDVAPPVAFHLKGAGDGASPRDRISSRLDALLVVGRQPGTANAVLGMKARLASVSVDGDLATVDYTVPNGDWGVDGSTRLREFLQQIVYTAAEEPGIRRVLITQNGGKQAIIGGEGLVVSGPATRESVAGYAVKGSTEAVTNGGDTSTVVALQTRWSVDDVAPGLARFVIETDRKTFRAPGGMPSFDVSVRRTEIPSEQPGYELGKWELQVRVHHADSGMRGDHSQIYTVDRTPLRAYDVTDVDSDVFYTLVLDDLRPWRVALLDDPVRIVVDVGGPTDRVSSNLAVYAPKGGEQIGRGMKVAVSGEARAFEASVLWRLKSADTVVLRGSTNATIGTSAVWGGFDTTVEMPNNIFLSGPVTLEVYEASPKDGSDTDVVSITLMGRD